MTRSVLVLMPLLLAIGCATRAAGPAPADAAAETPETPPPAPAPVLDTPSNVPERLWVTTPEPALSLRIEARTATLVQDGRTRELIVDKNDLIFAGRHVMAHDDAGPVEVLVAGKLCQDPVSGAWVPYSARVTLADGEFIFGCAQDAPPP
jgi:hypothetical protein